MKVLRFPTLACLALWLAAPLVAAGPRAQQNPGNDAWEKLKSLAGEWDGIEDGKPFHVSYKLVSSGTALMETLEGPDALQMVTMYTPERGTILMTHYCSMGNQPRMRATKLESDKLIFHYVDATNVSGPKDPRMSGLTLTFSDGDHLVADWTHRSGSKEEVGHFTYTRKK